MLAPLPLGIRNASAKAEEGAIAKGRKDVAAQIAKQYADSQRRMNALNLVDQRVAARGPLPGPVRLPPQPNMLTSVAAPAVAPSENDPNRAYMPMGKSPKLTPQDINGTPPPANMAQGVGGPQGGPPPEDEVAAIEAELKRREEIQALEQELARRGGQQAPQGAPEAPMSTDAMINEAVAQIPGGYKAWQEKNNPAPAGQRYVRDPLAQGEKYYLASDQPQGRPADTPEPPWNEQVASVLESIGNQIMTPITGRQTDPANDPMKALGKQFVEPMVQTPASAFRDPIGTFEAIDPAHQMARAYSGTQNALSQAMQGNWQGAKDSAGNALTEGANAALGLAGLKGVTGPKSVPGKTAVREPSVREAGKTLAAELVPGRKIRPQAYEGIANVLVNSGVPRNRVASGFARVVQGLKTLPDGVANREATVAQLFKREFGEEFPQVLDSIDAHLRGAALSLKPGDIRPGIINSVATEMRGSQVPFLQESGRRNLGENGLFAKEGQALAEMERLVEEGYKPLLAKPIGIKGQLAIQEVLQDPATAQYLKALEQDALEQGTTVGKMIATNPVAAAHWVQSKARAVAEANPDLRRTATMRREKILNVLEENVPGYRETRLKYGDQYGAADSVGLGDNFLAVGRNEYNLEKLLETYEGLSETQKPVGLASIWNAINTKIRGTQAKPGTPARTADIATIGTIDALNRLGPRGKAFADDLMAVAEENDFLTSITQRAKSQTGSNMQAIKEGDRLATKAGALVPDSLGTDMIAMGTGVTHAPIMSALKAVPEAINGLRKPRLSTREDMTRILMARPSRNALTDAAAPPKVSGPPKGTPPQTPPGNVVQGPFAAGPDGLPDNPARILADLEADRSVPEGLKRQMRAMLQKMIAEEATPSGGATVTPIRPPKPPKTNAPSQGGALDMTPDGYERTSQIGNATLKYSVNPDKTMSLEVIDVPQSARGQGQAGSALDKLLAEADAKGLTVYVEPRPIPSATTAKTNAKPISGAQKQGNLGKPINIETIAESPTYYYFGQPDFPYYASSGAREAEVFRRVRDKEWTRAEVRLEDITGGGQATIHPGFRDVPQGDGLRNAPVTLIKERGQLILHDGNHRAVAAAERGDKTIQAVIIDLDGSPANGLTKPQLEQFYAKRGFTKQAGGTGMVRSPNSKAPRN